MKLKLFDKNLVFTQAGGFDQTVKSPSGSVFVASTKANNPKIVIKPKRVKGGSAEQVLQFPLGQGLCELEIITGSRPPASAKGGPIVGPNAIIPGPKPGSKPGVVTAIIPGPKPKVIKAGQKGLLKVVQPGKGPMYLELGSTKGGWMVEADADGENVNVIYKGMKATGIALRRTGPESPKGQS